MTKIIRIERRQPRAGGLEEPKWTSKGYRLGDPTRGKRMHHVGLAVHVRTLDEAAELIERGFSLRMTRAGKRPSMISPGSLTVIRA